LEKRPTGPISFPHPFHVIGIQDDFGVGISVLGNFNRIDRTNRVADGATDTAFHVDLVLEVKIGDSIDWTESPATTAIDAGLLVDVIGEMSLFHYPPCLFIPWPAVG
jgi:hypothetical protein